MKTLVVLSALAAVALTAPTQFEQGSEGFKKFTNIPNTFKRERKSTQDSNDFELATGTPANLATTSHITEFGVSGRSFGLKKPIIIKKKPVGYQVYRDSDEVPAESGETCGSQVKVKFCDGKTKLKSSTIEDINSQMTEEDMKHSITLAKEAIENLQKDLKTERKPGTPGNAWNNGHSESDAELHQDIENAREALEHIHNNFGNLESMSLHTATIPEAPFTIAKTEEQRLAQWKEAIDTIQKNVEIAKNIEDSFRMAPDADTGLLKSDEIMANKHEFHNKIDHNMRASEDEQENKLMTKSCKADHLHQKSSEHEKIKEEPLENDMASSASTISENKMKEDRTTDNSQIVTDTNTDQTLMAEEPFHGSSKEKDADVINMVPKELIEKSTVSDNMNSVDENKEEKDKKIMVGEIAENKDAQSMKSVEAEDMLIDSLKKNAISTETLENSETNKNHDLKSAEALDKRSDNNNNKEDAAQADLHTEQSKQIDTTLFARSAEEDSMKPQQEPLDDAKIKKNVAIEPENHSSESKMTDNADWKTMQAMLTSVNDDERMEKQEHQPLFHPEMRSEDLKNMNQHLVMNPKTRWAEENNMQSQKEAMTSATGIHPHMLQHTNHHHHLGHGMKNQHFNVPSNQGLQSKFSEHFMTQEKAADQDMQTYYMNMRDSSSLASENQRFRWKPMHEGPRSAYGAPAAPAANPPTGNTLGVFPNAHVGACGIPLLLSCNPSVVTGSLSKPSAAPYPAPSYRSEDEFAFHTKRDVKKTHENLPSHLHRSPKVNMKTSTVLVAKQ